MLLQAKPADIDTIPPSLAGGLLFGQQHVYTQAFFAARLGQYHTVELRQFPHYKFLTQNLHAPFDPNEYADYLTCSWQFYFGKKNTPRRRRAQIDHFLELYRTIRDARMADRPIVKPVPLCRRPDGQLIIVDGNHRAAVGLSLDLSLPVEYVPPEQYLNSVLKLAAEEYYGTKRMDRPYQTIYDSGVQRIAGRRNDIHRRIDSLNAADLQGKSVLDLGCNIGMSCYLAARRGASRAVGVEFNPRIASAAARLNAYFAAPCEFLLHDLNQVLDAGPFDTVFCFSVWEHLKSPDGLIETIRRSVKNVLYFEGHAGSSRADYARLLDGGIFSRVELIGYGDDGVHVTTRSRPLFRCEI